MSKLYQCPYDEATICAMDLGCAGCEQFKPGGIVIKFQNSEQIIDKCNTLHSLLAKSGVVKEEYKPMSKLLIEIKQSVLLEKVEKQMTIEVIKEISCKFFRWWWNEEGTNTEQGFDKWWNENKEQYEQLIKQ